MAIDTTYDGQLLQVEIENDFVVIAVHKNYLKNSAEYGLTTGATSIVNDTQKCAEYFVKQFSSHEDDSLFNICIDRIAVAAIENGEDWISLEDYHNK